MEPAGQGAWVEPDSVGSRTGAGSVKMSISAESSVGQFVLSRLGKGMRRGLIEEICFY